VILLRKRQIYIYINVLRKNKTDKAPIAIGLIDLKSTEHTVNGCSDFPEPKLRGI
jgi:hypothetical protein